MSTIGTDTQFLEGLYAQKHTCEKLESFLLLIVINKSTATNRNAV